MTGGVDRLPQGIVAASGFALFRFTQAEAAELAADSRPGTGWVSRSDLVASAVSEICLSVWVDNATALAWVPERWASIDGCIDCTWPEGIDASRVPTRRGHRVHPDEADLIASVLERRVRSAMLTDMLDAFEPYVIRLAAARLRDQGAAVAIATPDRGGEG